MTTTAWKVAPYHPQQLKSPLIDLNSKIFQNLFPTCLVSYEVNLASQSSHLEVLLISIFCPKGEILILVNNSPLGV